MKNSNKRGYIVLSAAAGINFISAIMYVWSVISKALVTELNWTSKEASLPYTVLTISFVIAMVIFGKIVDSKGPRIPATAGGILIGIGLICSGMTTSPILMVFTMGILVGAGSGIINVATTATVVKWFSQEKKGMVTGIVVAGVGLSSAFYSPLSNYLINSVGISKTFSYLGIFVLLTAIPLSLIIKNPPQNFIPENKEVNKQKNISVDYDWKYIIKDKYFYKLWVMLGLSSSAGLMIIGHISNIAKLQIKWEAGFILVIILSIFNSLGRVLGGLISDKVDRLTLVRFIFILQMINMFSFAVYSNVALLSIGVAIAGLCYGGGFAIFPAMASDAYGSKNFGMNYGILFTAWGLGGVIGPMTAATILDFTGTYNYAYIVAGVLLLIAIGITFMVKKK
ncbi:OFA family MFS transporter [Tissierella pigra]|uniref:OFA family MFS transporter n=1 Tax=Tissierella pigra TaxID=2607614 RepID=A0A6N7Y3P6_9FIRM|nr:OFA family MFS transporter [Tissierella pigra]MSU02660.1 OFA family MFS transporter [Tissierella pigra]